MEFGPAFQGMTDKALLERKRFEPENGFVGKLIKGVVRCAKVVTAEGIGIVLELVPSF